ncbi:porin [Massilia niastensis]|uniref:porin n=1 Tax=Massilia niastensis TaxID=544911 RepID=UPI0003738143|nr:porin [Massilia niastensis]
MKQKILAAALLASLPLFAQAQTSVTIYGLVDASVGVEDSDAPGEDSRFVTQSGTQSTSRIGFRGTEDLGNGLKALFNLEAGVAVDTGAGDSQLFQRRAVVGLQGNFGTVTVGREYGPIASVAAASDTLGQGFYGSNLAAFSGTDRLTRRLANSVNYKSNPLSGFTLGAAYSAGETATGPSADLAGVSLEYANAGLYLGVAYQNVERLASDDDNQYGFGAGYKFGDFEVRGGYLVADRAGVPGSGTDSKYEQGNLGVSYATGPNKFFLNFQQQRLGVGPGDSYSKGSAVTLAYTYTLSKRTNIYSTLAHMRNGNNAVFGLTSAGATLTPPVTALGADPRVFNVGVRHSF